MGKKKNRQVNDKTYQHHRIRTFNKYQDCGTQQRPHTDYHNSGLKFIRIGDVFIMNDNEYEKGSGVIPDTKVIRFTRPVIVLSICDDLATVIPLTTKNASFNSYPVKISPDKMSYALLSQITTVDISRLDHRVGYLRKEVFNELREQYAALIMPEKKSESTIVVKRNVPLKNPMDIIRFENWTIYTRLNDNWRYETYLFIKIDKEFIAVPILSRFPRVHASDPKCLKLTEGVNIDVVCGQASLDKLNFVGDDFYLTSSDWYPIAVESKESVREHISKILGAMYGIYPKTDAKFHKDFVDITNAVLELSGYERYVETMLMLTKDIYLENLIKNVEPKADDEAIVWNLIHKKDVDNVDYEFQEIVKHWLYERFIETFKIFSCDVSLLEMLSTESTDAFNKAVFSFLDDIVPYTELRDGSENNIVDPPKIVIEQIQTVAGTIDVKEENCIWLAKYASVKMEELKSVDTSTNE